MANCVAVRLHPDQKIVFTECRANLAFRGCLDGETVGLGVGGPRLTCRLRPASKQDALRNHSVNGPGPNNDPGVDCYACDLFLSMPLVAACSV
jgi:hypothetical protein